ncbi:MAG: hypothetical protein GYB64_19140, partial [Chloroflexi bacterium]|nr:hypothetical protein [Chloroflexota bacterium]
FEPPDTEELPAAAPRPLETLSSPESPAPVTHDSHPTGEQPPVVVRKGVPLWVVIMLVAGGLLTTLCVGIFAFGRGVNFTRQVAGLVGMGPSEETITTTNEELLQGAEALDVDMNLRFSTTVIEAFDEEDVAFTSEYTRPVTLDDLTITYDVEEGLGTLTVRQPERLEDSGFTLGDVLTRFELQLAENLPVNLRVNAGTGSLTLDLRDMIVYELDVTGGVGVTEIRLPENGTMDITLTASFGEFNVRAPDSIGDLAINSFRVLGGGSSTRIQIPPVGGYEVDVQTGVGQVIVELPEDIAARVEIDSAMSDIAIRDPRLLDVGENVWQTEDYEPGSSSAVLIRVQAGVGSVEISDY